LTSEQKYTAVVGNN